MACHEQGRGARGRSNNKNYFFRGFKLQIVHSVAFEPNFVKMKSRAFSPKAPLLLVSCFLFLKT